jgi:N-acetylglutamate synthase-like GNAT family acetyltransferase
MVHDDRVTPPLLRRAAAHDAPALADLAEAAYAHYVPRIGRRPMPMDADYLAAVRDAETWVLDDDGEVVGCIVLKVVDGYLLLENIAVAPGAQGQGLGSRLLAHTELRAGALGLTEIRLFTNEAMVENIVWYGERGFAETHRAGEGALRRVFFRKSVSAGS